MLPRHIVPSSKVKGKVVGDKLMLTDAMGNPHPIIKISKDKYMTRDGEIKDFDKKSVTRADNLGSMNKTLNNLRDLINNNFFGMQSELWVTLTYKQNMTDIQTLRDDYEQFIRKLRRKYGALDYIYAIEPQERGAWHIHALIKSSSNKPLYIPNDVVAKKWKQGFTKTKRLHSSDNVGMYLTAYLANLDVTDTDMENDINTYTPENTNKRIKKGGRLHLYPANINFYTCSNGIKQPKKLDGTKYEIMTKLGLSNSYFAADDYSITQFVDQNNIKRTFQRETYKMRYN